MEAKAISKNIRISPQKVRQVINVVRGMNVERALNQLHFTNKKACGPVEKAIRSAVANLFEIEDNKSLMVSDLYVKTIFADEGFVLKRIRPRAMGRAARINKRSSHLTVVISTK
jgi:large subunit ribosomal protein L22